MTPEEARTSFSRIEEFIRIGSLSAEDSSKSAASKPSSSFVAQNHAPYSDYQSAGFIPEERALKANNLNVPSTSTSITNSHFMPKAQGSDSKPKQPAASNRELESVGNRLRRIKPINQNSPPKRLY